MAGISLSPAPGSIVSRSGSFTFSATLSGATLYKDAFYDDPDDSFVSFRGYNSQGVEICSGNVYNRSVSISGNTASVSVNFSSIMYYYSGYSASSLALVEARGSLPYDGSDSGHRSIMFDGTTNASGTWPTYQVRNLLTCTAPTSVTVVSSSVAPGSSVKLSWKGAGTGGDSGISAYKVYRATSATGTYSLLTTVSSTATSGSTTVVAPTTDGSSYYYKVQTISATTGKDSGLSTAYATLTAMNPTACGAPTDCTVDSTLSLVATTLRWGGATSGVDNNISRYEIQRRSRTHKGEWGAWSAFEVTSGTSLSVSPPATAGHYYQYRVRAQGTAGETLYSDWKESTNTLRKAHKTVPAFTDQTLIVGQTDVKAIHITELQEALNNILLPFMDENKIAFIAIDKDSDAKHWGDHVQELKAAIDSTGVSHDSWVVMQGEVTADVIDQIRRIVRAM